MLEAGPSRQLGIETEQRHWRVTPLDRGYSPRTHGALACDGEEKAISG
jgi:hypothetical protein